MSQLPIVGLCFWKRFSLSDVCLLSSLQASVLKNQSTQWEGRLCLLLGEGLWKSEDQSRHSPRQRPQWLHGWSLSQILRDARRRCAYAQKTAPLKTGEKTFFWRISKSAVVSTVFHVPLDVGCWDVRFWHLRLLTIKIHEPGA